MTRNQFIIFAIATFVIIVSIFIMGNKIHAQTWRIPVPMTSTERLPAAPPVKIGPEEQIRTMADAERIAREQK
jgi:hypothetical protein